MCPYSLSVPGGVQAQVVGIAGELRAAGHQVEVFAPGEGSLGDDVICVGRSIRVPVNGSVAPMAPQPSAAWRAVHLLRKGDFDVIHLHEPLAPSITIPVLLAHPAPIVGTFHAVGERTPYKLFARPLRHLAGRIDARVAVSESAARLARQHLGGDYEVLFNGIDLDRFTPAAAHSPSARSILFLGRHEPRKGLEVLLEAMRHLPEDVTLLVGGDEPDRDMRRRVAEDGRVHWLGRLSDEDKLTQLAAASVVCAPSLFGESFGVVLLEAMATGTPAVVSDLDGYRALSGDGRAAVLVPPGDARRLAEALGRVLRDDALARDLHIAGRVLAADYSMAALTSRYLTVYERVVRRRSHRGRPDGTRQSTPGRRQRREVRTRWPVPAPRSTTPDG